MKKLLIGIALLAAVMAVSAGTTVATAHYAPELLPKGEQGKQGLTGPRGPSGPKGLPGTDGADGADGTDATYDEDTTYEENSDDSADECSSRAGGTDVCMDTPEYDEMCRQIWEEMQDERLDSGGFTDAGSQANQRYSRNSCNQR